LTSVIISEALSFVPPARNNKQGSHVAQGEHMVPGSFHDILIRSANHACLRVRIRECLDRVKIFP
jgi:hypothetical protein